VRHPFVLTRSSLLGESLTSYTGCPIPSAGYRSGCKPRGRER
jgi:hypothetical protein